MDIVFTLSKVIIEHNSNNRHLHKYCKITHDEYKVRVER